MVSVSSKGRVKLLQQESRKHFFENAYIYIPIEIKRLYSNWNKAIKPLREMQRNNSSKQNSQLILLVKKNICRPKVFWNNQPL